MSADRFPADRYTARTADVKIAAYMLWELLRLLPGGVDLLAAYEQAIERERSLYPGKH